MSEQSMNNFPSCATTIVTTVEDDLNLIEVMEIFSTICVTHPIRLLQILDECEEDTPDICRGSSIAGFMSLKLSPFGRRFREIH
ncbi:MAG: hypothetical protein M3367_19730 [Acidobacteriota bacterium]|nr:hypothetical protein [Acidobacteriota bacterium]